MKRKILFCLIAVCFFSKGFGQNTTDTTNKKAIKDLEECYHHFPGGEKGLNKFLSDNLKWPKQAMEKDIHGIVYISIIVDTVGKLYDIKIYKGVAPELDEEALRVFKKMPKWRPFTENGKTVERNLLFPIGFKLHN
jgi:protein TonB